MVAVDSCGDSSGIHARRHELENGHLRSRDVRDRRAWQCARRTCAVASWQATRCGRGQDGYKVLYATGGLQTHIGSQLQVRYTALDVLVDGVVQVTVKNLLGEGQGTLEPTRHGEL